MASKYWLITLILVIPAADTRADARRDPECPQAPLTGFLDAWAHSDADRIAAQFTRDADVVIPTGHRYSGRTAIRSFYRDVFAAGYAGSHAEATIQYSRSLGPNLWIADGLWHIARAGSSGQPNEPESGVFSAVLVRTGSVCRIVALREQSQAYKLESN